MRRGGCLRRSQASCRPGPDRPWPGVHPRWQRRGYTTLCALAFQDVFRGGASLYGVSDPEALGRATHKFEGDYLDWLIGDPQRDAERYRQRTPLLHAGRIKVPVIFFQGELDAVVVPEQTRSMLEALKANGIEAEGISTRTSGMACARRRTWRMRSRKSGSSTAGC